MMAQEKLLRTSEGSLGDGGEGMKRTRKKAIFINGMRKMELVEKINKIKG